MKEDAAEMEDRFLLTKEDDRKEGFFATKVGATEKASSVVMVLHAQNSIERKKVANEFIIVLVVVVAYRVVVGRDRSFSIEPRKKEEYLMLVDG